MGEVATDPGRPPLRSWVSPTYLVAAVTIDDVRTPEKA